MVFRIPSLRRSGSGLLKDGTASLRQWVDNLPLMNVAASAAQLESALEELNRARLRPAERHDALELLGNPVVHVIGALRKSYLGKPLPLKPQELENADQATGLCRRMAASYRVLVDSLEKRRELTPMQALAIHRAMRHLGEVLLNTYQIYVPCPEGVWRELHTLYATAARHGVLAHAVHDNTLQQPADSTIEDVYKQILLLSLACPFRLRQAEITRVYLLLSQWAPCSKLVEASGDAPTGGFFGWDLDADEAPGYLDIGRREERAGHWCVLDTGGMAEPVRAALDERRQSGGGYSAELEERILQRLMLSWGVIPKRQFSRHQQERPVELVVGLKAIHGMITGNEPTEERGDDHADEEHIRDRAYLVDPTFEQPTRIGAGKGAAAKTIGKTSFGELPRQWENNPLKGAFSAGPTAHPADDPAAQRIEHWKMQDMSAGGYCLLWDSEEASSARVGELIAIRTSESGEDAWHLGVIRWMKFTREHGLGLGLQMMSPGARPVWARLSGGGSATSDRMQGILLPGVKGLNQEASLLLPGLPFRAGCVSRLTVDGGEQRVKLTRQLEDTGSFAQFQFHETGDS